MVQQINRQLDRLAHGSFSLGGKCVSPFRIWSGAGLIVAVLVALSFTIRAGLSPAMMLMLVAVNLLAAFALGMAVKVVTGNERHTHYHYEIAVAVVTVFTLWSLGQPVLPYLDVMVIGKGVLLAFGRLGCFMSGCCHGRPCRMGVCYSHVKSGFARHYLGVRLFPVQLIESLIVWFLTGLGGYLLLSGARPGTSLSVYVVGYAGVRFFIEFLRGDPQRPYFHGYSEAQWTAVMLLSFVVLLEYSAVLPLHLSHVLLAGSVLLVILAVSLNRGLSGTKHKLLEPHHVAELAAAFALVSHTGRKEVQTVRTSQGVQVSASRLHTATMQIDHYSLSQRNGEMTEKTVRVLLGLVPQFRQATRGRKLVAGNHGVFHLLVQNHRTNELSKI